MGTQVHAPGYLAYANEAHSQHYCNYAKEDYSYLTVPTDYTDYPDQAISSLVLIMFNISYLHKSFHGRRYRLILLLLSGMNLINPGPVNTISCKQNQNKNIELPRGIKIGHLNVRDLLSKNKKDDLALLLHTHTFDIFVVAETWLYPAIQTQEIHVPGFQAFRQDRKFTTYAKRGGGLCIYVREGWSVVEFPPLQTPNLVETLKISVSRKSTKPFNVIGIYRPKKLPVSEFSFVNSLLLSHPTDTFLVGDINLDFSVPLTPECYKFRSNLLQFGYSQLITDPTHNYSSNQTTQTSIIDLIITNRTGPVTSGVLPCSISPDHDLPYAILGKYSTKAPARVVKFRSLDKCSLETRVSIANRIDSAPWWIFDYSPDVNELFRVFVSTVLVILDSTAPIKTILVKARLPKWMTPEFKKLLHERDKFRALFTRLRTEGSWEMYRKFRNRAIALKKSLKAAGIRGAVEESAKLMNKAKAHWRAFNEVVGRNRSQAAVASLIQDGERVTDRKQICDMLCNAFSESGFDWVRSPGFGQFLPKLGRDFRNTLQYIELSVREIENALSNMNIHKPPGEDGVPARFFRMFATQLSPFVTYIFNASLFTGVFPECLKLATVIPLYKGKGKRDEPNSYRPISILSPLSKALERLVYNRLSRFLLKERLLSPVQHGFRNSFSTESATITFTEDCYRAGDKKLLTGAIFLDYKSAFPSVPLAALQDKLLRYGIRGRVHKWISSYLEDRPLKVSTGGECSASVTVRCGVPQGSVLGPLLFSVYINDLPKAISNRCKVIMYADDVILYCSGRTRDEIQLALQEDFDRIAEWSRINGLRISVDKTKSIIIYRPRSTTPAHLDIRLGTSSIEAVETFKYLGLWVDQQLTWNQHCDAVHKKMNARVKLLQRHQSAFSKPLLKVYCDSLVLSVLSFQLPVWGSVSDGKLDSFDSVLVRLLKRVLTTKRTHPSAKHLEAEFVKLNWLTTRERCDDIMLKFFFKHFICTSYFSDSFRNMFSFRCSTDRNVRKPRNLHVTINKSVFGDKSFSYRLVKCWNRLPASVQNHTNLADFSEALRNHQISSRAEGFLFKLL
jgi:hypothetical protein